MNFFNFIKERVSKLFFRDTTKKISPAVQVSDTMASAISSWFRLFYQEHAEDKKPNEHRTNIVNVMIQHISTIVTNEIDINTGTSERAKYIKEQIDRSVLPYLQQSMQLAAVGGEIILKPFVSGKSLRCEAVSADRFYPTRISCTGAAEAGFFTDFETLNGKGVVRIEKFNLQVDGLHLSNRAYYEGVGSLGSEIPLTDVPRWKDLPPDIIVHGVDRPLFAQLRMPLANTIDNTSRLPVSLYANSVDAIEELDRIYSEFLWEIHTGKRRKIIDSTALKPNVKANDGTRTLPSYDIATDEYITLDLFSGDTPGVKPFDDYTPEMRVEAYQKAIDIQLRLIEMQCGFSSGTFTFDVKTGKMTATQVISEDRTTYNTAKAIQERGMLQGLCDLVYVMDVYATLYSLAPSGAVEPSVTFGDSIFEDTAVEFARRKQLVDSRLLKPEKFIAWYFGVSEEEAKEYIPTPLDDDIFGVE